MLINSIDSHDAAPPAGASAASTDPPAGASAASAANVAVASAANAAGASAASAANVAVASAANAAGASAASAAPPAGASAASAANAAGTHARDKDMDGCAMRSNLQSSSHVPINAASDSLYAAAVVGNVFGGYSPTDSGTLHTAFHGHSLRTLSASADTVAASDSAGCAARGEGYVTQGHLNLPSEMRGISCSGIGDRHQDDRMVTGSHTSVLTPSYDRPAGTHLTSTTDVVTQQERGLTSNGRMDDATGHPVEQLHTDSGRELLFGPHRPQDWSGMKSAFSISCMGLLTDERVVPPVEGGFTEGAVATGGACTLGPEVGGPQNFGSARLQTSLGSSADQSQLSQLVTPGSGTYVLDLSGPVGVMWESAAPHCSLMQTASNTASIADFLLPSGSWLVGSDNNDEFAEIASSYLNSYDLEPIPSLGL
ncbi:hypothetical protein CEUSTIGMA_g12266.t1 [Chlamydomonas eustigma]|uniref:Uncharacterized protein n=1 Tax=Chlamydomonas eustigma TaxID=1157962 RepID=A0A250XP34_9CHLO|nr:hypothetical protein CEUSTIGMA_g12266.t1 [Chlamydomonas eustigma]|eukprot:GAX84845.1 hypothetical protein CEUSTIGMA_g12266.t1 [Chlamydomonas eustigma]